MRENTGINKIFLLGQITTEPQLYTHNKIDGYHFKMVTKEVHEKRGEQLEHLEYHEIRLPITLLLANTQLRKDQFVHIEGKIHTEGWTDEHGVRRYKTEIIALQFNLLDREADKV